MYKKNDYNVVCDICGLTRKRSQCKKTWDGYLACVHISGCWYPKHPFDTPPPPARVGRPILDARPVPTTYSYVASGQNWENIFLNWEDITNNWEDLT